MHYCARFKVELKFNTYTYMKIHQNSRHINYIKYVLF